MAACVAGIAGAVEVNGASVHMGGSLVTTGVDKTGAGTKDAKKEDKINFFTLDNKDQKDSDALVFDVSTEKSGAHFQLWYNYGGDTAVQARSVSLWFKPIDQVKVTVGDVCQYLYTERLHWWKDIEGYKFTDIKGWWPHPQYANRTGIETKGVLTEVTPISGLTLSGAFGMGSDWSNLKDGDFSYTNWGVTAKYQIVDNISAGISYRDEGTDSAKVISLGVDFGNWGTPYYAFIMPRFVIEYGADRYGFDGIGIDNYISYSIGSIKLEGRFPVIIRLTDDDSDPSYMFFDVKASYGLGAYTPYIEISNDDGSAYYPIVFNDELADCFGISVRPGVTFSVGKVSLDASIEVYITPDHEFGTKATNDDGYDTLDWGNRKFNVKIPVTMDINF